MEALKSRGGAGDKPVMSPNVRHLCRLETQGGGQVVMQGRYAVIGHFKNLQGTTIMDIAEPRKPKIVSAIGVMMNTVLLALKLCIRSIGFGRGAQAQ